MLGHLVPADDLAHPRPDLVLARQAALLAPGRRGNGFEQRLGGLEQRLALAGALLGQQRIAAHHQTLPGVGVARDLHQVLLVEQRQLHRARFDQRTDRRPAQRAHPVQARRLELFADPRLGQHPPVADQHHRREPEALAQLLDLRPDGHRVGGVAGEHLHRHRTSVPVAQQPELDLHLAALAVPGMTALGQRAGASLHPHRGQVIEHQGAFPEMALGQGALDAVLALQQPVHRRVQVVLVQRPQAQLLGEGVARGGLGQPPSGGEFGARFEDPGGDHRQHPVALGRALGVDEPVQGELAKRPEHCRDRAMGHRTHDVEGVVQARHRGAALEQGAQVLHERRRPPGQVCQGALAHLAVVAVGLAKQDGGRGGAVGDGFDIHGHLMIAISFIMSTYNPINTWLHNAGRKTTRTPSNQTLDSNIDQKSRGTSD